MRQRILDAAQRCIERWGPVKTSMEDIATEAGVSRRTVYQYFATREDLITALAVQLGNRFGQRLLSQVSDLDSAAERLVEYALLAIQEYPREPVLSQLSPAGAIGGELSGIFARDESAATYRDIFTTLLGEHGRAASIDDGAEILIRFIHSLTFVPGPRQRSGAQLRELLKRHMVPALALEDGQSDT